jgi:hypothetical protein
MKASPIVNQQFLTLPPMQYNGYMRRFLSHFTAVPFLVTGLALLWLGLMAMNHIVDNFWPFDVARLDLVRATALGRADAAMLLQAANSELILAFLASVLTAVTGLVLPLVYYLNRRFSREAAPRFLLVLRQSMWIGLWISFCVWLQMNRSLGIAVILLVAAVFVMFEILLQIRTRAAQVMESV